MDNYLILNKKAERLLRGASPLFFISSPSPLIRRGGTKGDRVDK